MIWSRTGSASLAVEAHCPRSRPLARGCSTAGLFFCSYRFGTRASQYSVPLSVTRSRPRSTCGDRIIPRSSKYRSSHARRWARSPGARTFNACLTAASVSGASSSRSNWGGLAMWRTGVRLYGNPAPVEPNRRSHWEWAGRYTPLGAGQRSCEALGR